MGYFVVNVVSGFSFASFAPLPLPTLAGPVDNREIAYYYLSISR